MKVWEVLELDKHEATDIAKQFNVPLIVALILQVRGITDAFAIEEFLSNDLELSDPYLMIDMDKAVNRINKAINSFEKICIYGDYDADGVTSTSLLYSYLSQCQANVMYYIPDREKEGYGMNINAIDTIKAQDVKLIITVDNGISAVKEIEYANSIGIDTVVTDHHTVPEVLPNAVAVVNPHRKDCESPYEDFAGVGVVFKLIMALEDEFLDIEELLQKYSDICTIGTIGDIVPLTGENRVIVKYGLEILSLTERLGLRELMEESAIYGQPMSSGKVSFTIVPRINACGRLALSEKSVQLLTSEDTKVAKDIAKELGENNTQRKQIEREILQNIIADIDKNPHIKNDRVIVVSGENYHAGVIGIVASRLREIFGKPVIVITKEGETSKASGRSLKGFSLIEAITYAKDCLLKFGGHPMAVGFSIKTKDIDNFRQKINEYANKKPPVFDTITIDCKLNPQMLTTHLVKEMSMLEPYGASNATPVIGLYNMTIDNIAPVGGGKHLKLTISRDNKSLTAMRFGYSLETFPYKIGDNVNVAVNLDLNIYNNIEYLSVIIKEIAYSDIDNLEMLTDKSIFEKFSTDNKLELEEYEKLLPVREDFAKVYRYISLCKEFKHSIDILLYLINDKNINYGKLMVILTAMNELNLIKFEEKTNSINIKILKTTGKADLNSAIIIIKLKDKIDLLKSC